MSVSTALLLLALLGLIVWLISSGLTRAGAKLLDPRVAGVLLPTAPGAENKQRPADPGLSARESEVLELLATGMSNRQIGRSLGIAERTVKVHVGNVFRRIGVADRTSAALWFRDHRQAKRPAP